MSRPLDSIFLRKRNQNQSEIKVLRFPRPWQRGFVFYNVMTCSLAEVYPRFTGSCYIYHLWVRPAEYSKYSHFGKRCKNGTNINAYLSLSLHPLFQARSQNCEKRLLASSCLSVCPSARMQQLGSH
jgi:hypothetical protein